MRHLVAVTLAVAFAALAAMPASAQSQRSDVTQVSRQRVVVTPGRAKPGPNSTRECEARLVQQYRASGTVIVPVMNCWWQ